MIEQLLSCCWLATRDKFIRFDIIHRESSDMIFSYLLLYSSLWVESTLALQSSNCNQDILDRTFVTRCGPSNCEPLLEKDKSNKRLDDWPSSKNEVVHIVSSRGGDRLKVIKYEAMNTAEHYYEESHANGTIFVDTNVKYQRILGFGSTLTDASCKNIDDLSEDIRAKLINDYFSPDEGIGLNLVKVPIGSTKYSYTNYVLDEPDSNQVELSAYDVDNRIPIIKDAMKAAGKLKNRFKVLTSSASAPPDHKINNQIIRGGLLRQNKINDYATYLSSYIAAYKTQGINIWSLILNDSPVTVARESNASEVLDYNSMAMRPSDTVKLIDSISKIRTRLTEGDKFRLLLLGDNKAHIPVWADAVFKSPEVAKKVAGVAFVNSNDRVSPYDSLSYVTRRYPTKYLLAIQSAINAPIKLGNWQYAENYATEIVKNLEYGSVGWIDFNLALNLEGGPYISDKFKADAAVMIDPKKGVYYRNPMLYAIAHLSRYVKPGSIRVKINFYSSPHMYESQHIAFITPDNYLVVVVLNNNIGPMPVNIGINTRTRVEALLDTKSFNTFIFQL